jgi:hypothetical protein
VTGRDHRLMGKNNQDAYGFRWVGPIAIAVVCDGCGSGRHSEVGAQWGARVALETIAQAVDPETLDQPSVWEQIQRSLLDQLQSLLTSLGGNLRQTIRDYGLFTLVGAVLTPAGGVVFSLGDGLVIVDGVVSRLGPFPNNQPPYLAYGLLEDTAPFQVRSLPAATAVLVGTDGVEDLLAAAANPLPGKSEPVGPISQFWDDRYFTNPDQIRRRLTLINRDVLQPDWSTQQLSHHHGWLRDDTTFVVLRRTPC